MIHVYVIRNNNEIPKMSQGDFMYTSLDLALARLDIYNEYIAGITLKDVNEIICVINAANMGSGYVIQNYKVDRIIRVTD